VSPTSPRVGLEEGTTNKCASKIFDFDGTINLKASEATVKRARPREGTGEARLLHGRTTAEVAECLADRVAALCVAEREQAGGHLPGYTAISSRSGWGAARRGPR
jgi:hypothetical protein